MFTQSNWYYIFGKGATDELAKELDIPVLGRVPIVEKVVESGDSGKPITLEGEGVIVDVFMEIAQNVVKRVEEL